MKIDPSKGNPPQGNGIGYNIPHSPDHLNPARLPTEYFFVNLRMKKFLYSYMFMGMLFIACKSENNNADGSVVEVKNDSMALFPVTEYLSGQLTQIEKMPVTLLHTITVSGSTDSQWVDRSRIGKLAAPFLRTQIDSALLTQWFHGSDFLDQTMGLFTITYTAKDGIPDSIDLRQVIVYINPQSRQVQRVYFKRDVAVDTIVQLTWLPEKWFTIRKIVESGDSTSVTTSKVTWNFSEDRP